MILLDASAPMPWPRASCIYEQAAPADSPIRANHEMVTLPLSWVMSSFLDIRLRPSDKRLLAQVRR